MWKGFTGMRRRNGIMATALSVVIASVLLYLSFYISFLYLLIPVVILVIFHFAKSWRFTDRAFYGFVAIIVSFLIAMGGISYNISQSANHSVEPITVSNTTYDVSFNYTESAGIYYASFSLPSTGVAPAASLQLLDLFTNDTLGQYNVTMTKSDGNFTLSQNLGSLGGKIYVLLLTFNTYDNSSSKTSPNTVEFLGPILVPFFSIYVQFAYREFLSYFAITFLFFMAFVFLARTMSMSRQRAAQRREEMKKGQVLEEKKK